MKHFVNVLLCENVKSQ